MDLRLRNRVFLITGGSRGLGFATAKTLIEEGARVVLGAPHEATAGAAASRLASSAAMPDAVAWVVADNADPARAGALDRGRQGSFWAPGWGSD